MPYVASDAMTTASPGSPADEWRTRDLQRTTAMTIEILYLTAQLQRWLNRSVARHLAAQAAKLSR
jgi:hypothetical protein